MILDLVTLLFPKTCVSCSTSLSGELEVLCVSCSDDLPINPTFYDTDNFTTKVFYGRLPINHAASLLLFQKRGITQKILHELKYRKQEDISAFLGDWMAEKLLKTNWHNDITMVVPVPIHPNKKKKRGYNQVSKFAAAIAKALHVPFREDVLLKTRMTKTQVFKKRFARSEQAEDNLILNHKEALTNQHILLVDDIITTGATMETCGLKLLSGNGVSLSLASMAITP